LPGVPAIAVKPESVAAAYYLRTQLKTRESQALFPAEVLNELYATLGNVRDLMAVLTVATQILVLIAVLVALLVGFLARRRQFAVLRAIGASRRYVFTVIWLEVGILIAAGSVIGLVLGWGGAQMLSLWLARTAGFAMPVSLGMSEFALCGLLALCGFALALLPASLGQGQSIAVGLRH
jgi:putative ABC transport system permease protein